MSARSVSAAGIIAAGEGTRLRQGGYGRPKPLVPIDGIPLIEHVTENLLAAGIEHLAVIFNEDEEDCARFLRSRYPALDLEVILRTTPSSLESFLLVLERLPAGRVLISTVDSWCPRTEFLAFMRRATRLSPEVSALAVTPLVADERPLWVTVDDTGRIVGVGGATGTAVTAGFYLLSERVRALTPPDGLPRLRDYLQWLCERGEPLWGISLPTVVDVDRPEDVVFADALSRRTSVH